MKLTHFLSICSLAILALGQVIPATAQSPTPAAAETKVPVVFSGGYETVGADRGRPVILIASALKVTPEVFSQAFSNVHPAPPGEQPTDSRTRENKQTLMKALGPYGVTDDRLNEVSNFYRYSRSQGEMWRNTPAKAYATVVDGKVTGITVTDAGAGYSSTPTVTVEGQPDLHLVASLAYGTDFAKNGSIESIKIAP